MNPPTNQTVANECGYSQFICYKFSRELVINYHMGVNMTVSVFNYEGYKKYLRDWISATEGRSKVADLARAAGCDRTYLSQALNGKVHLTADHIINLGTYLDLSESEQSFLLMLLLHNRANTNSTKALLAQRMEALRQENLVLTKKIRRKEELNELAIEDKARYYSTWIYGAVHILTSIPGYSSASAISERLHLPLRVCEEILGDLVRMGLVMREGNTFTHSGRNLYISTDSSFNAINHVNWRTQTLNQANSKEGVHYTTAFSVARSDWPRLKAQLMEFIEKQREMVHGSGSEELFCFCCDLFSPGFS
jgi:uncharacterized protein (TIGR02147 family)